MDVKILTALQQNARMSNQDLAQQVGLSPSPCWRRVRRLEQEGIIRRYAALLDPEQVGLHLTAFAHVSLENHHSETVQQFTAAIQSQDSVLECFSTSGEYDYLLRVVAPSMADYETFLSGVLMQIPAVRSVNTSFVLKCNKSTTTLPLPASFPARD
ncbi:MAG: Lrp/AsnC family transcriptional regulator [Alphaproteobacteria bacterium]|nr:MAG: Lrp/AsnC family transcriptional regulator [Alphaproteobacteria bacterium]